MKNLEKIKLGNILGYEQPTKYIVKDTNYSDNYKIPVLTAGKTFILGYTNEKENIYKKNLPVIIFDDFTTAIKYVDFPFKVKSSAMKILHTDKNIADIKYLFYYMLTIKNDTELHKRYWISKYANIEINLPNLNIQKKISDTLDKVNNLIDLRKQQLEKLDLLIKSKFIDMFGDPIINPKKWEINTINDISLNLVRGPFGSSLKKEFFVPKSENVYKIYEQKNAIKKNVTIGSYYIDEDRYKTLQRFTVSPNDILMSCSGTIGELFVIPTSIEKGIINQALLKFTLNNKINIKFFLFMMQKIIINIDKKGSGIQNIGSVKFIKKIKFGLPPMKLQNQFAEFVEEIEKQKLIITQSLEKLELLYKSLMQKYFD